MSQRIQAIRVGLLRESELEEAGRIVRLAFGTFLGLPNPLEFMGDRDFIAPRFRSRNTVLLAARHNGNLIGSNVATRWGSFGFFGPLTVSPEYWSRGVAQLLLSATLKTFRRWRVKQCGLFTFANSPKHVALYQKFGFWPGPLTALMRFAPKIPSNTVAEGAGAPILLSTLPPREQRDAISRCATLAGSIDKGLDLSDEIRSVLSQHLGEVLLLRGSRTLDAFAICIHGAGTEGGARTCYVKFAAARTGNNSAVRFTRMLDAIDAFASARKSEVEAGVSLACEQAFSLMQLHGFRMTMLGVAMLHPHGKTYSQTGAFVLGDWR